MKRTVLITGASGSIGGALAKSFALAGDNVILHYNNSKEECEELCAMINNNGYSAKSIKADLCSNDDIKNLADFAIKNDVDILINNAGVSDTSLFTDESAENIDRVILTNLSGMIKLTRLILPHMLHKKSGCIINISSVWGECGASCEVVYSAAKAGIIGFTKALAKEVAPSSVRVNCISPGVIRSRMLNEHSEETLLNLKKSIPLNRLGEPSDIAGCARFLTSSSADYITGEVIRVNGGFYI